jgi:hypothetical protein
MRSLTAGLLVSIGFCGVSTSATAQNVSPIETVRTLGLDSADVGGIRVHYVRSDREHALQLAALCEEIVAHFKGEFSASFSPRLAVLRPEHWFVPYAGGEGEPYGIPWGWIPDSLIAVPASLEEGVLITGPDRSADLRRVRFVMLHEFGHLASKQLLHPGSGQPYSSVRWFDELIATYFAYSFVRENDPDWARTARDEWQQVVDEFTPPIVSLDWSHFRDLPPEEFARTYAWYQNLLNLRAAALYEEHGLEFLHRVRDRLDWQNAANWTTNELVPILNEVAPGFQAWASAMERGDAGQVRR